jgi:hypothetical protein
LGNGVARCREKHSGFSNNQQYDTVAVVIAQRQKGRQGDGQATFGHGRNIGNGYFGCIFPSYPAPLTLH